MTDLSEDIESPRYDVLVIGAGPAGCEAALAAASAGATVLCLTINLDMVGFPPATPILADDSVDRRHALLKEVGTLGGRLPGLLEKEGVATIDNSSGCLLVDRRLLGLAWKETLENASGLELRQALVTNLEPRGRDWLVTTSLSERFSAASVVVAAGTFLHGRIVDGDEVTPGGRWAEIPSDSLAVCLKELGVELAEVWARTSPRLSSSTVERDLVAPDVLFRDGQQLDELYALGMETEGDRTSQLEGVRSHAGLEHAWMTRASYMVLHEVTAAEQVGENLGSVSRPGLFLAGRAAGGCNYTEAAALGLVAGRAAAAGLFAGMAAEPGPDSGPDTDPRSPTGIISPEGPAPLLDSLIDRIVHKPNRPVTIRVDEESGC
ncbi:MAG: FAD-dependent oxidoreductase [Actinobacteria bacterium]|nr:FAD-dependent oxidoreductase [Actinomycetota bacterium]